MNKLLNLKIIVLITFAFYFLMGGMVALMHIPGNKYDLLKICLQQSLFGFKT